MKRTLLSLCLFWGAMTLAQPWAHAENHLANDSVCAQMLRNIYQREMQHLDVNATDRLTADYLKRVSPQGAFRDIDYTSRQQTSWRPLEHLDRLHQLVLSYLSPQSRYYQQEPLYATIVSLFAYWHAAFPKSTNWWYREIGEAQRVGLNLALMRFGHQQLPDTLERKMLLRLQQRSKGPAQRGSQGTGANKMDIALQWIYRTCLQEDRQQLQFAVDQFFLPIRYNLGQGIQRDDSYLQHGSQLYTGGYGAAVLSAFFKVASYLKDTPYERPEKTALISEFVRLGYLPTLRGQHMLYNVLGRGICRRNATHRSSFASSLEQMKQLDPEHASTYQAAILRLRGEKAPADQVEPFHRHYWRADHTLHQRPDYTMDVRMASTRTLRCENGNGENLKGYFLTEGGTCIVRRGDEYAGIFPAWDWCHLPGTTVPAVARIPLPGQWGQPGQSHFAGGVSDGRYGVTAYQMTDEHFNILTQAHKAWFFFDNEVVCMGSGIASENDAPVHTTVNQCLLRGAVQVAGRRRSDRASLAPGTYHFDHVTWVNHDSVSYHFPEGGNLMIRSGKQSGNWKDIYAYHPDSLVEKEVFFLGLNHGVRPQSERYVYYVVPNTENISTASRRLDALTYLNTEEVQAVYNASLHQLGAVFHAPGRVRIHNLDISSTQPCVVLFTDLDKEQVKVHVADPSHQLAATTLKVKFKKRKPVQVLNCSFPTAPELAGSTQHDKLSLK